LLDALVQIARTQRPLLNSILQALGLQIMIAPKKRKMKHAA